MINLHVLGISHTTLIINLNFLSGTRNSTKIFHHVQASIILRENLKKEFVFISMKLLILIKFKVNIMYSEERCCSSYEKNKIKGNVCNQFILFYIERKFLKQNVCIS